MSSELKYKNGRVVKVDDQVFFPNSVGKLETGKVVGTHSDGIVVLVGNANQKVEAEKAMHADDHNADPAAITQVDTAAAPETTKAD